MTDRSNLPYKHIPVRSIDPESKIFHLQSEVTEESRLGIVFEGDALTGADEGVLSRLKSVLTMQFPTDTFVQFGLLSEPDVNYTTANYLSKKSGATGLLKRLAEGRAKLFKDGTIEPIVGMSDIHLCRQKLIISVSCPCDNLPTEEQFAVMADLRDKIQEGLQSVGLWLVQLDEANYLAVLRRFFTLYDKEDFEYSEFSQLREQVFGPGADVHFHKDHVDFNGGQYFSKTLSVKHFPQRAGIGIMNQLIGDPFGSRNQITDPFWMVSTIYYPDREKKLRSVRTKHAFVTKQTFGGMASFIPMLGYKKRGMDVLMYDLEMGGGLLCELNFTITLFARDMKRLNGVVSSTRTWAASFGYELREDSRILKELYYNLLPLGITVEGRKQLHRFHTMSVSHAIHLLPLLGNWSGTGHGGSSIFASRRGTTVMFDPYDSSTNYNGVLAAGSGAGKSVLAQQVISDWLAEGSRAWVIDQGRSYEKLCRAVGGQFIEFSEDSDICLNPFSRIEDIDEEMDILKAMFEKMASPNVPLSPLQSAALGEKIKSAYEQAANRADVDMVAKQCLNDSDPRVKDLGRQLFDFTSNGTYGRWFNGVNNINLDSDFVVLELKELSGKKTLQQVVLIQLFASISNAMYHTHGRKKYLMIDEAWSLIDDPIVGKAIETAYRTVRKHSGSAWLITQSVADLYESAVGRAVIASSAFQIIMQQDIESIERAIKDGHLRIDIYTMNMLKSVHTNRGKYSEFMLRHGENWGIARFCTDRFSQIMFSTTGWERDEVFSEMDNGRDVVEIIDQFVGEGR